MRVVPAVQGRNVFITGASTGLGSACALHLDHLGYSVFAGVRRESDGEALARRASSRLTPIKVDITEAASVAAAAEQLTRLAGARGLAGLVNNAGISVGGPLEFLPLAALRRQLDVNVLGHVAVTQAVLPLIRRGRGRLVFMGSTTGRMALPFAGPYCASKSALDALATALRMELRPWDIPVSLIVPGAIATPIWRKAVDDEQALWQALPQEARDLYGAAMAARAAYRDRAARGGLPAGAVATTVARALSAPRPRTRYVVGWDAWRTELVRLLPARVREEAIVRFIGLPGQSVHPKNV